jgi:hypothetical protein
LALSLGFMPINSEAAATTTQKAALWKMSMGIEPTCVSLQLVLGLSSDTMFFGLPFGQLRPRVDYIDEELGFVSKRQAKARFRDQILKGWDYKCAYCREHLGKSGTLDHVRPKSRGGETSTSNLVAACFNCNVRKSSNDWKDWFRMQHFWEPHLEDAIRYWLSQ